MYMFYLVSAIAVSSGIGAFTQYDTLMQQRDVAAQSREVITTEQQDLASRSLRREFQINPSAFPTVSSGGYSELSHSLVASSIRGGYLDMNASSFYLSSTGDILAVIDEGPAAPSSQNGDTSLGYSGRPQYAQGLLNHLFGNNYQRGAIVRNVVENLVDSAGSLLNGIGHAELDADSGLTVAALETVPAAANEVISELTEVSLPNVVLLGHLDLEALDYNATIESVQGTLANTSQKLASATSYEPADFLAIEARFKGN